jgi:hypothetical protein
MPAFAIAGRAHSLLQEPGLISARIVEWIHGCGRQTGRPSLPLASLLREVTLAGESVRGFVRRRRTAGGAGLAMATLDDLDLAGFDELFDPGVLGVLVPDLARLLGTEMEGLSSREGNFDRLRGLVGDRFHRNLASPLILPRS